MKRVVALALAASALVVAGLAYGANRGETGSAAQAAPKGSAASLISCGNRVRVGIAAPITGPAASLGQQQLSWARYFVTRWNRFHRLKVTLVQGDTRLPDTAAALRAAQQLAGNSQILGMVGPAGSQEVVVSSPPLRARGLAFVSGSATRTTLTREAVRRGFFFRVVPPDAIQAQSVANYITRTLRARNVYIIDDQETYSVGLSDEVQRLLRARGVTVTRDSVSQQASDFSSLVAKVGNNVNVVYIPWQLADKAQLFGQQMREQGKRATLFGSDGLFDPSNFKIAGAYVSFFPVARTSSLITQYRRTHGGDPDFFGAPSYAATQVVVNAINRACRDGQATRTEVRNQIRRTNIAPAASVLGLRIRFDANGDIRGGRFGIFRIATNGAYNPVG
ncbi:MAG: branched-chain amino acid ABC transporter substrate-binding protein [Actinomycetota bacterium]|nr:branched-chain amino acid ABC transporter substrate-binding protein [Actinomycetota bacterium]